MLDMAWDCPCVCHISFHVGLCVARSTVVGNAKASDRRTGDGMAARVFYVS